MVEGLLRMMDSSDEVTGPVNLGNPQEITIREAAQLVLALTGSRSKIVHRPLPEDDPKQRRPDISEAQRVLNWRPIVSLETGLKATIEYFEGLLEQGEVEPGV
jgi:UDP-glucuronate decarboxylase